MCVHLPKNDGQDLRPGHRCEIHCSGRLLFWKPTGKPCQAIKTIITLTKGNVFAINVCIWRNVICENEGLLSKKKAT